MQNHLFVEVTAIGERLHLPGGTPFRAFAYRNCVFARIKLARDNLPQRYEAGCQQISQNGYMLSILGDSSLWM
jgi:hypothetical protein